MSRRKKLWIGIFAAFTAGIVVLNPAMAYASEVDEVIVFGSGSSATEYAEENLDYEGEYEIDEEEIWAMIDKDDLRSFVDVEQLRQSIDKLATLEKIDLQELLGEIDEVDLARQVDNDKHPVDVISTKFPLLGEVSPFDFIIDPLSLVYETAAAKYGGGSVEEGATVLFRNSSGDYMFSSKSDLMTIANTGNVPVRLTIKATITNPGGIEFVGSRSELEGANPKIFMALCDSEGISAVMTEYGEATIDIVLNAAPDGTYSFEWNNNSQRYDYILVGDVDESVFDSFSFQIYADCNTDANWGHLESTPTIAVSWHTEVVPYEKDELDQEVEQYESEIESMVAEYLDQKSISPVEIIVVPTIPVEQEEVQTIQEEIVPQAGSYYVEKKNDSSEPEENQAETRNEKIAKLRKSELIKLVTAKFKALLEEELEKLIDIEVEKMAKEQFELIKADKLKAIKEEKLDSETFENEELIIEENIEAEESKDAEVGEASESKDTVVVEALESEESASTAEEKEPESIEKDKSGTTSEENQSQEASSRSQEQQSEESKEETKEDTASESEAIIFAE